MPYLLPNYRAGAHRTYSPRAQKGGRTKVQCVNARSIRKRGHPVPLPATTLARRNRALHLLLEDLPYREIASRLGASYNTTREDIRAIYKQHNIRTKAALRAKLRQIHAPVQRLAAR